MMEIQIGNVNFQPTKTGKDKWVVATNEGNLSVWDGKMAEQLNKIIGQSVKVDIRPAAPDTNYLPTITKVDFESAVKGEPTIQESMERMSGAVLKEVQNGERSLNGQEQNSLLKEANNEILKLKTLGSQEKFRTPKEMIATELVKAVLGIEHVALENDVAVENAYRMYKRVLELQG